MKRYVMLFVILLSVGFLPLLFADQSPELIDVSKLGDKLYLFKYTGTYDYHHLLFTGSHGNLLIDTGYTETADD